MIFRWIDNKSIIDVILKIAALLYGPLLGLFAFWYFHQKNGARQMGIVYLPAAPLVIWVLISLTTLSGYENSAKIYRRLETGRKDLSHTVFGKFKIGYELLIYNGILTYLGYWAFPKSPDLSVRSICAVAPAA